MAALHCQPTLIPLQAGRTVGRGRTNNRRIPLGIKELLLDQPTWFEVGGFRWELGPSRLGLRAVRKDASPLSGSSRLKTPAKACQTVAQPLHIEGVVLRGVAHMGFRL